jgi:hypothetical protein
MIDSLLPNMYCVHPLAEESPTSNRRKENRSADQAPRLRAVNDQGGNKTFTDARGCELRPNPPLEDFLIHPSTFLTKKPFMFILDDCHVKLQVLL